MPDVHTRLHVKAAPAAVYEAWLVPRLLGQWMFTDPGDGHAVLRLQLDPRTGGQLLVDVRHEDRDIRYAGRYLEMEHPHRLVFAWSAEAAGTLAPGRVQLDLAAVGAGCQLDLMESLADMPAVGTPPTPLQWSRRLPALAALFG